MEGDALPRLQPRVVVDVVQAEATNMSVDEHASSARRATKLSHVRASLPKSAGAVTSALRRRTGSSSGGSGPGGRPSARMYGVEPSSDAFDPAAVVFMQRQLTTPPTVVRPPSTRTTGTPRKATTREPTGDPQSDQHQQSQWHAIIHENEQLRLEMSRLQQQLVEKMRGHAKILVGGGQFRASGASSSLPNKQQTGTSSSHACVSCVSLRESFKKAREGFDEARGVLSYRIVELERGEAAAQTSLNQQSEELVLLRDRIVRLQQAEEVSRRQLQSQQTQIELLEQELLTRHTRDKEASEQPGEPQVAEGYGRKSVADSTTQCEDVGAKEREAKVVELMRTAETANVQLFELQGLYAELQETCASLREELSAAASDHERVLVLRDQAESKWQSELASSEDKRASLSTQCVRLDEQLRLSSGIVAKLERDLEAAHSQLVDAIDEHGRHMMEKTQRVEELEARELEYAALTSSLRCRVNDLEERMRSDADDGSVMAAQIQQLTHDNHSLVGVLQSKTNELKAREQEVAEIKVSLSDTQSQLRAAQEAFASAQQETADTAARLAAAEADAVAHGDLMRRLRKSHATALEKAMQSVVRLCVVAPTVHVHLNTGSGANASATSSASGVTCKAALPQAQLRRVVEQEVLPLFATVFVQSQEGTSPQGTPMDPWLQSLLRDMQESLASHLQKLYTSTAASSSTVTPPSISGL